MVIREAQLADIFEITNILIEEMYTEVGIGEPSRSKVLYYITFLFNDDPARNCEARCLMLLSKISSSTILSC